MSSKLDYLKKYAVAQSSNQQQLKKRLMKQVSKDRSQSSTQTLEALHQQQRKGRNNQNKTKLKSQGANSNRFIEDLDNEDNNGDFDEGPMIEGDDGNLLTNEAKQLLLKNGMLTQNKQSGKWLVEEENNNEESSKEQSKKRKRKDSRIRSSSSSSSSSDSSESSGKEGQRKQKRKRHDSESSESEQEVQINTESQKNQPKIDKDGDISLSEEDNVVVERAGLQSVSDLREFNKKHQDVQNQKLMDQIMKDGNAQQKTIYRNKEGQIVDMKDKMLTEKDKLRIANEQQLKLWKGGAKQVQEAEERKQALRKARDQPFTNYDLDPEADSELKMKERFGDPLKLIKSSTMKSKINQQSYRVITTASGYRYLLPKCKFPAPGTRFDVEAGHRWDGVDRSNGYERKWIEKGNSMQDNQEFFRKWATEDM